MSSFLVLIFVVVLICYTHFANSTIQFAATTTTSSSNGSKISYQKLRETVDLAILLRRIKEGELLYNVEEAKKLWGHAETGFKLIHSSPLTSTNLDLPENVEPRGVLIDTTIVLNIAKVLWDSCSLSLSDIEGRTEDEDDLLTSQLLTESIYEMSALLMEAVIREDPEVSELSTLIGVQEDKLVDFSWELLEKAAEFGNPSAQHRLSTAFSTGIYGDRLVPASVDHSLFLEYQAALSGSTEAALGMGYRYSKGIGVMQSCTNSLPFYELASNEAAMYLERGRSPAPDVLRLITSESRVVNRNEITPELVLYYSVLADSGDTLAATLLGTVYLLGNRLVPPSRERAIHYLKPAAATGNSQAAGMLSYVFMTSYRDNQTISDLSLDEVLNFARMAEVKEDPSGALALGIAYEHGFGVDKNTTKASELYFRMQTLHPDGGLLYGDIVLKNPLELTLSTNELIDVWDDSLISAAHQAFTSSIRLGNVLAQHRVAQMANRHLLPGMGCEYSSRNFKNSAERGPWLGTLTEANRRLEEGNIVGALSLYARMAALGISAAQYNTALLLDRHCDRLTPLNNYSVLNKNSTASVLNEDTWNNLNKEFISMSTNFATTDVFNLLAGLPSVSQGWKNECSIRSLAMFALSGAQGNSEALVHLADGLFYGSGGFVADSKKAAEIYTSASKSHNTRGTFALGILHQLGDGLPRDLHLAKRYFDQAAESDPGARLPRDIALLILNLHDALSDILGRDAYEVIIEWRDRFKPFLGAELPPVYAYSLFLIAFWVLLAAGKPKTLPINSVAPEVSMSATEELDSTEIVDTFAAETVDSSVAETAEISSPETVVLHEEESVLPHQPSEPGIKLDQVPIE